MTMVFKGVTKFWAWILVAEEPHHILGAFYEGTDGQLHMSWRLATREDSEDRGMERRKTFQTASRPIPEDEDEIRADIVNFTEHCRNSIGAHDATVISVEDDLDAAIEALKMIPGVDAYAVH